jgi:hypothetical protein
MKATRHVRAPNVGGQYASRTMNAFSISPCGYRDEGVPIVLEWHGIEPIGTRCVPPQI